MELEAEIAQAIANSFYLMEWGEMPTPGLYEPEPSAVDRQIARDLLPLVKRAQAEAWEAAWRATGEGFNGEYPDEGVPWNDSAGRSAYDRWSEQGGAGA